MLMTATLYHGPGSRERSLQVADDLGTLVTPPVGGERFGVEDARAIVRLVIYPQAVDKLGIIVVGLDHAAPKTQDVLLKILEEHDPSITRILLWASEAENVSSTVRSRCLEEWCPFDGVGHDLDDEINSIAASIAACIQKNEMAEALTIVLETHGREVELLDHLAYRCRLNWDSGGSEWWGKIRPVYNNRNPTNLEVIAALTEVFR
jgi:hypothetical protein